MPRTAFHLQRPMRTSTGVVFASPHSGRDYPQWFLRKTVLDERAIRSSEDAYVDRLLEAAPQYGAPLLLAGAPRAFVDLNRAPDEMDPALVKNARRVPHNPRVASGLGVVPRVVSGGRAIYRGKITLDEAHHRVATYWRPYHDKLQELLDDARVSFGRAVLIDVHSMPSEAARSGSTRADIVLGDRFGASASGDVVDRIEAAFAAAGFKVARNTPFAGAYIAQHYGKPDRNQHAVQVEIDRGLYLDEADIRPSAGFNAIRQKLAPALQEIADIGRQDVRLAAE
ncbi:MAG: N-formylglutamate amidohydrolase [Shimia sp.]